MIAVFVLAFLSAYREIEILINRGSRKIEHFKIKFWQTDHNSIWKNFDSFHVMGGLFTVVMFYAFYLSYSEPYFLILFNITNSVLDVAIFIIAYWVLFYYIRNLFMHIIFRKKAYRQWNYLLPVPELFRKKK